MDALRSRLERALNDSSRYNEQAQKAERRLSEAQEKIALQEIALDDMCVALNEREHTITELRILLDDVRKGYRT